MRTLASELGADGGGNGRRNEMIQIPSESDWRSEPWCLDAEQAYKNLAGKSHDETIQLFCDNAMVYQEDVMFMPDACFPFYASAYASYLMSELAEGDSDGANCFFGIIDCRINEIAQANDSFKRLVIDTLVRVGNNQSWYDAEESIYGSFAKRSRTLVSKLQPMLGP